jgi:hypothetical protein
MPPEGFEHTILASARPQSQALDSAATGISSVLKLEKKMHRLWDDTYNFVAQNPVLYQYWDITNELRIIVHFASISQYIQTLMFFV